MTKRENSYMKIILLWDQPLINTINMHNLTQAFLRPKKTKQKKLCNLGHLETGHGLSVGPAFHEPQ